MKNVFPLIAVSAMVAIVSASCKQDDQAPTPATPTASAYPPGYPPPGYQQPQGYATAQQPPPGYAQPQPTGYATAQQPPPGYATAAPTAPAAGPMAVPGPLALPCSSDAQCGAAHCNTQYQKCAFPCTNAATDCIQGAQCLLGACVPKLPGSP